MFIHFISYKNETISSEDDLRFAMSFTDEGTIVNEPLFHNQITTRFLFF